MKNLPRILMLLLAVALVVMLAALIMGKNQSVESAQLIVYHEGRQYIVLDRGDEPGAGLPTYYVRYLSEDPGNDAVRAAECADLYAVIARHVDPAEHRRVVIYAVAKEGRLFGLLPPREVVESRSVAEVLKYKPEPTT